MQFLGSLLALLRILPELIALAKKINATIESKKLEEAVKEANLVFDSLNAAKTPQEKLASARAILALVRKL